MRYLILAAGMGRRMGNGHAGVPKCLIDIGGETLLGRLLRQIRESDAHADVHVVLGYRSAAIAPLVDRCRVIVNPFFDITGINASLWFARDCFDRPLMVIHGDVVLADELAADLFAARAESLVAYDSSVLDPREINVALSGERVTRFGVNFAGYAGAYAGVIKLSAQAARLFADTLDRRIRRGFNEPRTYYFFVMRRLIAEPGITLAGFDFARYPWKEIDYPDDVIAARSRVAHPERNRGPDDASVEAARPPRFSVLLLDHGRSAGDAASYAGAIRAILDGRAAEAARDRNSTCYRVEIASNGATPALAIVKATRPGPQRTNPDTSFAGEAEILARLPAAGLDNAPELLARVAVDGRFFLFTTELPGHHPEPRRHPLDETNLRAIADGLGAMDRQGLMHYDLKSANILIDGDRAGFIDFEFARFEDRHAAYAPSRDAFCEDFNVSPNPFFPARSNVANFEFRALHRYLLELGAPKEDELLGGWLRARSSLHGRMAAFLRELPETSVERLVKRGGIGVDEARRRLNAAAAFEDLLAELLAQGSVAVARVERSLIAFRCAVFERDAGRAALQRRTTLAAIGGGDALPAAYRHGVVRVLDLVERSVHPAGRPRLARVSPRIDDGPGIGATIEDPERGSR